MIFNPFLFKIVAPLIILISLFIGYRCEKKISAELRLKENINKIEKKQEKELKKAEVFIAKQKIKPKSRGKKKVEIKEEEKKRQLKKIFDDFELGAGR